MTIKIIISGAGLSGLAFAAAIGQQDPSIMIDIYERDSDFGVRAQGYSIGLKGDAGLMVVGELGAWASLAEDSVPITNFVVTDQRGRRLLELPNDGTDLKNATVRVRRTALRDALRATARRADPLRHGAHRLPARP